MQPVLEIFTIPPFGENTYLFGDSEAGQAVVIDPGGRVDDVLRVAAHRGVAVTSIVNTHAHIDHVLGVAELKERTGAPFLLHPDAAETLDGLPEQARRFGVPDASVPGVDADLVPGESVSVGRFTLAVVYTPGHAPGHVTLVVRDAPVPDLGSTLAFCGDVIFAGSIGRTDLPGGDHARLMRSIDEAILTLPDDAVLLPGHGPATTVDMERRTNPFVRQWLTRSPWAGV